MEVLVVDDEPKLAEIFVDYLNRCGCNAVRAGSAAQALRLMHGRQYDVVVSDMTMPGLNGLDLLAETRKRSPKTRVIVITGSAAADSKAEALRCGAFAVLEKPFSLQELGQKIREAATSPATAQEAQSPAAGNPGKEDGERSHSLESRGLEILAAIPAALALVDSRGMVLDVNEGFVRRFALQERQVRGTHLCIGLGCPLTSSSACSGPCELWRRFQQAVKDGRHSGPFAWSLPFNSDGMRQRRLFRVRILVLAGRDGTGPEHRHLALLMEDVSEFLDAERRVLPSICQGRPGDLTRDIAHELAQPVNAISAQCQLLKFVIEQQGEAAREMVLSCLEELQRQTHRMTDLLNHLRLRSVNEALGDLRGCASLNPVHTTMGNQPDLSNDASAAGFGPA